MPDATDDVAVATRGLRMHYRSGGQTTEVLRGLDLDVPRGRFVSVMGPSGSGKSTLLHLLGGLDVPTAGEVLVAGRALSSLSDVDRTALRRHHIGIVYQFFNLVPVLTVAENVSLPAVIAGEKPSSWSDRLERVLAMVGLNDQRDRLPDQLSGGQQQRAAIARALFVEPAVLLADEPTGNLDLHTGAEILALLVDAQRVLGQTIVMVTHDPRSAAHGDEVVLLREGRIDDRLEIARRVRGRAKLDPTDPARTRAVLRWLEQAGDRAAERDADAEPAAVGD